LKEKKLNYPEDFIHMVDLAKGSFGQVMLVKCKRNNKLYALKRISDVSDSQSRAFKHFDDRN
jgi:serine/threonine protein kinase